MYIVYQNCIEISHVNYMPWRLDLFWGELTDVMLCPNLVCSRPRGIQNGANMCIIRTLMMQLFIRWVTISKAFSVFNFTFIASRVEIVVLCRWRIEKSWHHFVKLFFCKLAKTLTWDCFSIFRILANGNKMGIMT